MFNEAQNTREYVSWGKEKSQVAKTPRSTSLQEIKISNKARV
jgi:hypothetical protein